MAGRPNGISCTYGQYTEVKSIHDFPHKEKDKSRHQAWVRFVRGHRPNWAAPIRLFFALTISMIAALQIRGKSL